MAAVKIHHRVVSPDPDQPVMAQDTVTEIRQLRQHIRIVSADRRSGDISAGHDQTVRHGESVIISEKQHVERCIGQHNADFGVPRRDRGSKQASHCIVR